MRIIYSEYTTSTPGKALPDFGNATFNTMIQASTDYNSSLSYSVGATVLNQGALWRCISAAAANQGPPTLPDPRNTYWEYLGSQGTFTWIAYASNLAGTSDFTTGAYDESGIIRKYIGIATNKNTPTESTDYTKYTWSKFIGDDGATGVSPVTASLTNPTVTIPTDSDGNNAVFTGSGTDIYVYEGTTLLAYDGVGTSAGKWKVSTTAPTNVTPGTISSAGTSPNTFGRTSNITGITQDTGSILYTITGKNSAGTVFSIPITQNFSRVKGAIIDTIRPSAPSGLSATSSSVTTADGTVIKIKATWTAPTTNDVTPATTLTDLSYYEISIKLATDTNYTTYQTSSTQYEWIVEANTAYKIKVVAVDKSGNRSADSSIYDITSTVNSLKPNAPTPGSSVTSVRNIYLRWTNATTNEDASTLKDLSSVEIYEARVATGSAAPSSSSATRIATVNAIAGLNGGYTRGGIVTTFDYYYWLKSRNTSGNVSTSFSTMIGPLASSNLAADDFTANTINANILQSNTSLPVDLYLGTTGYYIGKPMDTINGIANSTTISPGKISVNGTQTIQSTVSTWVYPNKTTIDGGTIEARTISADKIEVGLTGLQFINLNWEIDTTTANTAKWYSGGGTSSVVYRNDLGVSTTSSLQAGSVTWSGGTVYLYWVKPVTGTITATYSGTTITLTFPAQADAALPFYIGDIINVSGITTTGNAPNGTFTVTGSTATTVVYTATATPSGTLGGSIVIAPSIAGSTARGNAYRSNTVPIGTYQGGRKLTINYGKTIINGADITTGTVNADVLEADSGILNRLYLGSPSVPRFTLNGNTYGGNEGLITISDASSQPLVKMGYLDASTVGFELRNSSNQVLLNTSTPVSSIDNGQTGINLANIVYSQFNQATLPVIPTNGSTGTFSIVLDSAPSPAAPVSGLGSIRINTGASSTCYAYLAGTFGAYNIVLKPNTTYLYSAYVKAATASVAGQLRIRLDDVGTDASTSFTTSGTANTWTRVSTTFTTNSGTTSAGVRVANTTSSSSLWFTGIMIEEARGASATIPSPYVAPSLNGLITSSNTSTYISSLNADVITAGTISTDRLTIDGITLSKDVSTGKLKISDDGVNTAQITNNAVTDINSSFTASTVSIITSSYATLQTATITTLTLTDKVDIISNFNATFISGSNTVLNLRIKRGTTVIYTSYTWTPQYVSPAFSDTPGAAGTYTYTLEVANVGAIQQVDCSNRYLRLIRITK